MSVNIDTSLEELLYGGTTPEDQYKRYAQWLFSEHTTIRTQSIEVLLNQKFQIASLNNQEVEFILGVSEAAKLCPGISVDFSNGVVYLHRDVDSYPEVINGSKHFDVKRNVTAIEFPRDWIDLSTGLYDNIADSLGTLNIYTNDNRLVASLHMEPQSREITLPGGGICWLGMDLDEETDKLLKPCASISATLNTDGRYYSKLPSKSKKKGPDLPADVWNDTPIDAVAAWKHLQDLCNGKF